MKTLFEELYPGDRFVLPVAPDAVWTKLDVGTGRRHSAASIALAERGFGYNDPVCSFDKNELVEFVPVAAVAVGRPKKE